MSNKVTYSSQENLITRQNNAEKAFLETFEKEEFTLDNPQLVVNPYLINPLCALVMFKTAEAVAPIITVKGKRNSREDISHTFPAATSHMLPVLGLYENFTNTIVISLPDGFSKDLTIKTGQLPLGVCRSLNIRTSMDYLQDNLMFMSPAGKNLPVAFDYKGDIRWMLTENTIFDIKRVANGNILTGSSRFAFMLYSTTGIIEMNLLGKVCKEFRLPGGYHHDQFEMDDGNVLVLTQDFHRGTVEDMCVLIDRKTGDILKTWDFKTFIPQDVGGSGSQDPRDWFHNNSVWYDKATHSIILAGRHQDAVVSINYDTSELNWIIGDPEGWPRDMVDKYFFTPVGDRKNFDWQYEQHAALVCPNGDIMCFDNGQYRSKNKDNYIKNRDNFSRGVRYRIDTEKMEIEQVWQYGKERGQEFYSPYIGSVEYYDEGHYMTHSGGIANQNGYAADLIGPLAAKADPLTEMRSITVEEKDGVVMYELESEGHFYRAEKLPLYHDGDNATFEPGQMLGKLDVTPEFDTVPDAVAVDEQPPASNGIVIEEDEDLIVFNATFEGGTLAMLCLEGKEKRHHYFINTSAIPYIAMCSGLFHETDDRIIKMKISKEGLKGKLAVKVIINEKKYDTGVAIFCP
jgi:arylsulfate sulfotransferase